MARKSKIEVWKEGPDGLLDEGWWATVTIDDNDTRLGPFVSKKAARAAARAYADGRK